MAYDTLLFDMDGVLLTGYHTDRAVYRQAAAATLADFGLARDSDPPPGLVDPDATADIRAACDDLGLPVAPVWACRERAATTIENESITAGDRTLFTDVGALADLADRATIGIVSNNRHGTVRFVVDHFGLDVALARGRFPTIPEFGRLKPDPHFLNWVLDRLDTEATLFVGDRRSDVEAARRAGIDAALLHRQDDPPGGDPEPEHYVESLDALVDVLDD